MHEKIQKEEADNREKQKTEELQKLETEGKQISADVL